MISIIDDIVLVILDEDCRVELEPCDGSMEERLKRAKEILRTNKIEVSINLDMED